MTSPWTISAGAERVQLSPQRQGEITFTVTNNGPVDTRVVVDVLPSETADRAWFTVDQPQRLVTHGGSAPFAVRIAARPDAAPGAYWVAARAYSADAAPEETSVVSNRVAFELAGAPPRQRRGLLWLIPVAVLLLAVAGVAAWLLLRDPTTPQAQPTEAPSGSMPGVIGLSLDQARAELAKQGVEVAGVSRRHDPDNAGKVFGQSVPAGAAIARGDNVNLEVAVSLAPPTLVSPAYAQRFPQGGASPGLTWEPVPDAARYRVEVEAMGCTRVPQPPGVPPFVSCDYTGVLSEEGTADGTSFQPAPLYFPPDDGFVLAWANGIVRWRVIPLDDYDNPGPPSEYGYFEMTP
jgi:hypothetical protein